MPDPTRILVLFAHPSLQRSRVNRALLDAITGLAHVTVRDLYELYPDQDVDLRREQELVAEHDVLVFHHPLYWYSAPPLLKAWIDLVFEHGWAYGRGGGALQGKRLLTVTTTGAREEAYRPDGHNRYTMAQLLAPFDQTAHLCGMRYLPPFVVHGTHALSESDVAAHAHDYRRTLEALRDGRLDLEAEPGPRLNTDLDARIRPRPPDA